jgi:branched-chain amino acid transport system permease protein
MMLGGYLALMIAPMAKGNIFFATLIALVASFIIGGFIYRVMMHPMIGRPIYAAIIVTIGLSIIIRGVVTMVWGSSPKFLTTSFGIENTSHLLFDGVRLSTFDILTIVLASIYICGVGFFFMRTRIGIQMRASAENPLLASQSGINIYLLFALAWSVATGGATLCGILYGNNAYLSPEIGIIGFNALVVPIIGGMDSLIGVPIGAVIVGLVQNIIMRYVDPQIGTAAPMVILLVMLLFRPWGFFGTKEEIERV